MNFCKEAKKVGESKIIPSGKDVIYFSSPLKRPRQTAEQILAKEDFERIQLVF